ncbi:hypothetical protein QOZ80_6AG0519980 [Eleusine coracana subsp. coracana]|nr:hypothetical protein QOZ80_6AG0519980 [Eleusine coracana subsp. coracana]
MGKPEIAGAPAFMSATADEDRLTQLGIDLAATPPTPTDALVELLEVVALALASDLRRSLVIAIGPLLMAIVREEFLKHEDQDVKVLLSFCFCEITRITMPDVPYTDDVLKDMFYLIVGTFNGLSDVNSQSFGCIVAMWETLERSRLCVVMLDVGYDDLMIDMFQTFLKVIREDHEENILKSMQSILASIVDESDEIHESLPQVLLSALGWKKTGAAMSGCKLARNVIKQAAGKLEPYIKAFLTSSLTGDSSSSDDHIDHHGIILDVYQCIPKTHDVVVPYIIGQLPADDADVRSKAVELLGQRFSLPEPSILESIEPLFPLFLNRLTDTDTD